ncbi:MAG: LapA family protein [Burkholderiales bacterium]|jgi:uncharacterized integral membrane protein|nr:LapA family protein [Burkholderiales bacterium]
MNAVRWIIGMLLFIAVLLLAFDNADTVTLRFFGITSLHAPLMLVVFAAFAIGVLCGLIAGSLSVVRARRELKKVKKELKKSEQEKNVSLSYSENTDDTSGDMIDITPKQDAPDENR